jgi:hypothetical protein
MTPTLLATTLVRSDHSRSFHIRAAPLSGWEATALDDQHVVQRQHYADWHRVEYAYACFAREIEELRAQGWSEA